MNYKKLKRVFALGMAVLLSVSTSVYGGTMEVHAAEVISDNLFGNEVTDNLSLNENTENKTKRRERGYPLSLGALLQAKVFFTVSSGG